MNKQISEPRDIPLRLSWKCHPRLIGKLNLRPRSQSEAEAFSGVIGALLNAAEIGRWVAYSRNHSWYPGRRRYYGPAFTHRYVVAAVDALDCACLLEHQRAMPGSRGRQSRIRAAPALIEESHGSTVRYELQEPLRLKDAAKRLVGYSDTTQTLRLRREIQAINNVLAETTVDLSNVPCTGHHFLLDSGPVLLTPQPSLHRVFLRGSWDYGGRTVGWWQSLPPRYRDQLLLNGEPVARPDYCALHAQMIYAEAGQALDGDVYDIGVGFTRELGKLGFNIAVNARNRLGAIGALTKEAGIDWASAQAVYEAVKDRNAPIARAFGSDAGVRLMRIDSDIILGCLCACVREGIPALHVHDELIVPARYGSRAAEIMAEGFESRVKPISPCQVRLGPRVLHNGDEAQALLGPASISRPLSERAQ